MIDFAESIRVRGIGHDKRPSQVGEGCPPTTEGGSPTRREFLATFAA